MLANTTGLSATPPARTSKDKLVQSEFGLCPQGHAVNISYYDVNGDPTDAERIEFSLMDGTVFALQFFAGKTDQLIYILRPNGDYSVYSDPVKANEAGSPCEASDAILKNRQKF